MQSFFLAFLLIFNFIFAQPEYVVELSDSNFQEFIKKNPVVMVKFYSPGCTHCKHFAPEYELAAKIAKEKNRPYILAALDVNRNGAMADMYKIGKLPTVYLFINGMPFEYPEEREANTVLRFIDHMYKNIFFSTEIKNVDDFKAVMKLKGNRAILITNDQPTIESYKKISVRFDNVEFFHMKETLGSEIMSEVIRPAIILFKDFEEGKQIRSGDLSEKIMIDFLADGIRPKVAEFNQETIAQIFKPSGKKGIILLRSENEEAKKIDAEFRKLAERIRSEDLIYIISDIKDGLGQRVSKMLNVKESDLPILEILETKGRLQRVKYPSKSFTFDEMLKFVLEWKQNKKSDL